MTISTVSSRSWTVGCSPWTGAADQNASSSQYSNFSYMLPAARVGFRRSIVYETDNSYVGAQREPSCCWFRACGDFTLYVNGVVAAARRGRAWSRHRWRVRDTRLHAEVRNDEHYYSGLVYPPVLGTTRSRWRYVSFANALIRLRAGAGYWPRRCSRSRLRRKLTAMRYMRDFGACCAPPLTP